MNKQIFLLLAVFSFYYAQSQGTITVKNGTVSSTSNYSTMTSYFSAYGGETIVLAKDTKGSPYLNDNFQAGAILKDGQPIIDGIFLRYNAHSDLMTAKMKSTDPDSKAQNVIKGENYQIKIGNDYFKAIPTQSGDLQYCQVLQSGQNASLFKMVSKIYKGRIPATSSMTRDVPASFKENVDYFIILDQGDYLVVPSSKKKIITLFKGQEKALKGYIKENKLNLKKELDLLRLVRFYNTL